MFNLVKHKEIVLGFFNAAINKKDFAEAAQYLHECYIQHTPYVADGVSGASEYFERFYHEFPNARAEVKHIVAENNYVILFIYMVKNNQLPGLALMEMFRLENNKIIEHWNVVQEIPIMSKNGNNFF